MKSLLAGLLTLCLLPISTILTPLLVALYARSGRYPAWLVTPDDPFVLEPAESRPPHFGHYEEAVRKFYARFGRFWGDIYWLGFRNTLYGLAYARKPQWLKDLTTYEVLQPCLQRRTYAGFIDLTFIAPNEHGFERLWEARVNLGILGIIIGHKLSPIFNAEPGTPYRAINMDGRPVFSFRSPRSF